MGGSKKIIKLNKMLTLPNQHHVNENELLVIFMMTMTVPVFNLELKKSFHFHEIIWWEYCLFWPQICLINNHIILCSIFTYIDKSFNKCIIT